MTPRSLLRETAKRFRDAGIPDPETDSALLLSFLTGLEPLRLRLDTDTELPPGFSILSGKLIFSDMFFQLMKMC